MQLPSTPIPVVFKSSRKLDNELKKEIKTIPGSTRMYQMPPNTLVIWGTKAHKTFRLVGDNSYQYACIEEVSSPQYDVHYMSGSIRGNYNLNEFIDSLNILKPFLKHLYRT